MQGIDIKKLSSDAKRSVVVDEAPINDIWKILNKEIQLFSGIKSQVKESFYHELAILIHAGVDLKAALDLVVGEQKKDANRKLMENIRSCIIEGDSLSGALKKQQVFTPYEYYSIQIGEETGRLVPVLEDLALYFKKQIKQRRQITGAMMYPAIVTCTSFGAVFFMLNFIVPMFADIFSRTGGELPAITRFIVNASAFLKAAILPLIAALLAVSLVFYFQRKKDKLRKILSTFVLRFPVFGEMVRKIYLGRFCNSMALLTGAKVPLIRAIQLSRQMAGFYPIERSLIEIENCILHGQSLHSSLAAFKIYDTKMISLIKVGEEVNQLSAFFEKVAQQYNEDVEHQSALLSSIMEPFIIIFLGLFVGLILIAMYLPLFQLGSGFE